MEKASPKSRLAALLFAFFLGGLGAHRFYVGKTGSAIAQLILTCTIIGCIISGPWVLIDLIFIIAGSFRDGNGDKVSEWDPSRSLAYTVAPVVAAAHGNIDDIQKLADLKEKGIITEEEFQAKKKSILGV